MIQDAKGRTLRPGDIVMVPCKITVIKATETSTEYTLSTVEWITPAKILVDSISGQQLFRAMPGDPQSFDDAIKASEVAL